MPSFGEASPATWARMRASTRISTYEVLDAVKAGPQVLTGRLAEAETLDDMVVGGWITLGEDGLVTITDAGRRA